MDSFVQFILNIRTCMILSFKEYFSNNVGVAVGRGGEMRPQ